MSEPAILVFPTKFVKGLDTNSLEDRGSVELFTPTAISEAFATQYPSDAHFAQYLFRDSDGSVAAKQPRLNKSALGSVLAAGCAIELHVLAVDVDNVGHAEHTPETLDRLLRSVYSLPSNLLPNWYYSTAHGARLVWHLLSPIPAQDAEPRYRGLLKLLAQHGIAGDQKAADWTRLFRLPQVTR